MSGSNRTESIRLTDEQRLDWLRLIRSENVGPRTFRTLLNHSGSARAALTSLPDLSRRGGAAKSLRICSREDPEREMRDATTRGVRFIATGEPDYPLPLQNTDDAPPLLAVRGNIAALARPIVGIVGARNASAAGIKFAERLARDLGNRRTLSLDTVRRMMRAPIAPPQPPAPSRYWPVDTTMSTRRNMPAYWSHFWRRAQQFPKCRSAGNRAPMISRGATA